MLYGTLPPCTPFADIFPDQKIPILSAHPSYPEDGGPPCFVISPVHLSPEQLDALTRMAMRKFPFTQSFDAMREEFVRAGIPIQQRWFTGLELEEGLSISWHSQSA